MAMEKIFLLSRKDVIKALTEKLNGPIVETDKNGRTMTEIDEDGKFFAVLACALDFIKDPVEILNPHELSWAYIKQQELYDYEDVVNELDCNFEYYDEKFGIGKIPVTEEEKWKMVHVLRDYLDADADAIWSVSREMAVAKILRERGGCK